MSTSTLRESLSAYRAPIQEAENELIEIIEDWFSESRRIVARVRSGESGEDIRVYLQSMTAWGDTTALKILSAKEASDEMKTIADNMMAQCFVMREWYSIGFDPMPTDEESESIVRGVFGDAHVR